MKKFSLVIIVMCFFLVGKSQTADTLIVHYYENFPYAYMESNKLKGIEVDIIEEYVTWLKQKKNMTVAVTYQPYKEFGQLYNSVKTGNRNVIGLGSVTTNSEREKDVTFSPPYLQNVAVLITSGKIPTVKTKQAAEVQKNFGTMTAVGVSGSSHINYLNDMKKNYLPALKISTVETQDRVLESILSNNSVFGYVDIIAYWSFLKNHATKYLKIQKTFNEPKEFLGYIMPKTSSHAPLISEFFEAGFGFTSTKVYHQILEKYLGYEILESVEIK